jgi:CDP-2,3-bis-(O-geranylgeranyl)-sn-glycerol synthase
MLYLLLKTIWLLLPAYTPNNFAVLFGGGVPIDLGKNFFNGKRILGEGKTIRGFVFGVVGGVFCGILQFNLEEFLGLSIFSSLPFNDALALIFLLSFGSLTGDSFGSFIKRRLGIGRGQSLPLFDQLAFLVIALLFVYAFSPHFSRFFTQEVLIAAFILTPVLHLLTNYIAYRLGLKDVPW